MAPPTHAPVTAARSTSPVLKVRRARRAAGPTWPSCLEARSTSSSAMRMKKIDARWAATNKNVNAREMISGVRMVT
jgi:hypothetical protein